VLLVLSVVVAGYILKHERFQFPFIQASPYVLNAEFSTAQAVTPGQGQSVRVSGVYIGEIGAVTLKNGLADVQLDISQKYQHLIHTDATALLRPKTGLKDMFIEVNPGSKSAPVAKQGFTIPVANTNPDVDVDEILSSLDADSRSYLQLLVNGAGEGLKGKGGTELAQVFQRFEPTHRDLARLNGAVAVRGRDLSQLVNSLQRLNTALSTKQAQIVQLVDSSATVLHAFASQDTNLSKAIVDLPGTLSQTTSTLNKVQKFAKLLGPTAKSLLPAARSLPAANAALVALAERDVGQRAVGEQDRIGETGAFDHVGQIVGPTEHRQRRFVGLEHGQRIGVQESDRPEAVQLLGHQAAQEVHTDHSGADDQGGGKSGEAIGHEGTLQDQALRIAQCSWD